MSNLSSILASWLEIMRFSVSVKAQHVLGNVMCLPGRTMAYRRQIFEQAIPYVASRTLFGRPVITGDDRDLTTETIKQGFRAVYQESSIVYTDCPRTLGDLFKQQLRWYRSVTRETLVQMGLYIRKMPVQQFFSLEFILSAPILLLLVGRFFYELLAYGVRQPVLYPLLIALNVLVYIGLNYIKYLPILARNPKYTIILPLINVLSFVYIFPAKLLAAVTWLRQGWITR